MEQTAMTAARFALALICSAALAGCGVEADFSDDLEVQTLEAEAYQQEIAAIDRLVFNETPLGEEGVRELARVIEGLAGRVGGIQPQSKFLKVESLELKLLARRAGRLSPEGTGGALQNDWMRIPLLPCENSTSG